MTRLRIRKLTSSKRLISMTIPRSERGWTEDEDFEVRLSRATNEQFQKAKGAISLLGTFDAFHSMSFSERRALRLLEYTLDGVLFGDGIPKRYEEQMNNLSTLFARLERETGRDFSQRFRVLEAVAEHLTTRSPLELLLARHMKGFLKAFLRDYADEFDTEYTFSEFISYAPLGDADVALLLRILRDRELLLKFPSEFRVARYCDFMRAFGLRGGIPAAVIDELEDEFLVELQWFA